MLAEDEGRLGDEDDPGDEDEGCQHSEHSALLLQDKGGENHDEDGGGEEDGGGVTQGQLREAQENKENPESSREGQQEQIQSDLPVGRGEEWNLLVESKAS